MNSKPEFVHLHNHSEYSLLDGLIRLSDPNGGPSELLKSLSKSGAKGFGLTDHGNMYGAVEFYSNCVAVGLNPIVGCEMYLSKTTRAARGHSQKENCHLTVLARNFEGYQNLMKLATLGFTEGYYYDPRIDKELLAKHAKGLVVLSGCLKSELSQEIAKGNLENAMTLAGTYRDILEPGSFFLEIMDHGIAEQRQATKAVLEIHERTKIPLVATNDCHYTRSTDFDAHDARVCIATGRKLEETNRLKFESHDFYVKTPEEMHKLFGAWAPEALSNTLKIAEMCRLKIPMEQMLLPEFPVPEGQSQDSYLEELCLKGLRERFGDVAPAYAERLRYELSVIRKMGFSGYFLIVWDFIAHARSQGIPVGPGRGSGAGALVAYALRITNIDPLKHNLLFERFLNPDRKSMPDLDIDFADTGRDRVIEYVRNKYGAANVAQIITFGSLGAKLVVRDVGRVMGVPLAETDRIAKLIPTGPDVSLYKAMLSQPELVEAAKDPQIKKLLELSLKLEGLKRHTGVHAAGTVITKEPVVNYAPLSKGTRSEVVTTQYDGNILPRLGLLKVDFLGLRTLSIIDDAVRFIRARGNPGFNIDELAPDDAKTFELLRAGSGLAVFQLDSQGMRDLLRRLKPSDFNDIVSLIALFRPGPMQSGMLDEFVERKHGKKKIAYDHSRLEPILKDTYGCMVFQEQVMEISKRVADFTPGQADSLRKAMGKKIPEELERLRDTFVSGAGKNKISAKLANKIYDQMVQFGGYGFNKCLAGSTRVFDAETGAPWTLEELLKTGRRISVWSLGEKGKCVSRPITRIWSNGTRTVYRMRTILGKEIVATSTHPFYTFSGWKPLGKLAPGDRIATPRRIPAHGGAAWPKHQAALLGWVLSEGNTCHPSGFYLYTTDAAQAQDMIAAAESFDHTAVTTSIRRGLNELFVRTPNADGGRFPKGRSPWNKGRTLKTYGDYQPARDISGARRWLDSLGVTGCKATEKFIPKDVFTLAPECLSVFLGRLWSGDGFVFNPRPSMPFYATSSRRLARDLQDLLLKLGICARIHVKSFRYRGGLKTGFTVNLLGRESIDAFVCAIGPHLVGRADQLNGLRGYLAGISENLTSKDTVPAPVRALVQKERASAGIKWTELEERTGVSVKEFYGRGGKNKKGFRRMTLRILADYFGSEELRLWADSDIYWDTIASIESAGAEETFDVTVAEDHNLLADGLFAHNSHSAAYGLVAYQTAYLKANHPLEFMCAVATSEIGHSAIGAADKENKLVTYLEEAKRMGLKILPPDAQKSQAAFSIEDPSSIRFGLVAIKNVGMAAANSIVEARRSGDFKSLSDFCSRVDLHAANKKVLESLVKAGALDALGEGPLGTRRARLLSSLEETADRQARLREDAAAGQGQLFSAEALEVTPSPAEGASPVSLSDLDVLKFEKEVLGFYFSGHPLLSVKSQLRCAATHEIAKLSPEVTAPVRVAGIINQVKRMVTKSRGEQWARCTLEDLTGEVNLLIFPRAYAGGLGAELKAGRIVAAAGRLSFGRGGEEEGAAAEIIVEEIQSLETAVSRWAKKLLLRCPPNLDEDRLNSLGAALERHQGRCPVVLMQETPEGTASLEVQTRVLLNQNLLESIESILGEGSWRIESAS